MLSFLLWHKSLKLSMTWSISTGTLQWMCISAGDDSLIVLASLEVPCNLFWDVCSNWGNPTSTYRASLITSHLPWWFQQVPGEFGTKFSLVPDDTKLWYDDRCPSGWVYGIVWPCQSETSHYWKFTRCHLNSGFRGGCKLFKELATKPKNIMPSLCIHIGTYT
jgi:hypothetical protein